MRLATRLLRTASAMALVGAVLVGCATQASENFHAIHEGMTKPEVLDLLGKPSSTWSGEGGTERWQWGDSLSSLATSGVFHEADTARVWAVWFDDEGRVSFYSEPDWVRR
ncbi:MAG: outer membrane protein assembly factor BamE [Phycisphaerae bacterium]|nr:outer membrane protein assembly factor BamE [Phycisphaerae bacterium]